MSVGQPVKQMMEKMSNDELIEMLRREYVRKLMRYRLTDELFRKKYAMTYEEFEKENEVAKRNFSWEVESDAQEWEMAIDGISTCLRKLGEVKIEYANQLKDKLNLNLIFKNRRLCGYDSEGGRTHIHPIDEPESHIFTDKEVDIKEFTVKSLKLLEARGML